MVKRKEATFWTQTWTLLHKNWLTKIRQQKTILIVEILVQIVCIVLVAAFSRVTLDEGKLLEFPEQTEPYETDVDILHGDPATDPPRSYTYSVKRLVLFPYIHTVAKDSSRHRKKPRVKGRTSNIPFRGINVVPDTPFSRNFTQLMDLIWETSAFNLGPLSFNYFPTEDDLKKDYYAKARGGHPSLLALLLPSPKGNRSDGRVFKYTIRTTSDMELPASTIRTTTLDTCRQRQRFASGLQRGGPKCFVNSYFFSEFLALQFLVEQSVVLMNEIFRNSSSGRRFSRLRISMQNYPKEKYTSSVPEFSATVAIMTFLVAPLSAFPMINVLRSLLYLTVAEKESKLKDGLRMMGVDDSAYWFSWIALYGVLIVPASVLYAVVMYFAGGSLSYVSPFLLFVLQLTYGFSVVTFAFFLSSFIYNPKTALATGSVVNYIFVMLSVIAVYEAEFHEDSFVPLDILSSQALMSALNITDLAGSHCSISCISELITFSKRMNSQKFGVFCVHLMLITRNYKNGGIALRDLAPGQKGHIILYALLFLIFDTFFFYYMAKYFENILPNQCGTRKHPFYCFMSSQRQTPKSNVQAWNEEDQVKEDDNVEPPDESLLGKGAIRIRNVCKKFDSFCGSKTEGLKNISLDVYEGQITAILGKNGAGKSSLINILSGFCSVSCGQISVFGLDLSQDCNQHEVKKMTGVCWQNDLYFTALTVEEHLKFNGRLRGLSHEELPSKIKKLLLDLELIDSKDLHGHQLSGGQKRKLSVAMAMIGKPKIVLLDEPTAGLDPASRRHFWAMLKRKKKGRVILLTTHFMDEADILADRKAIIHNGILRCAGSSLFLKNRYGTGYLVVVETKGNIADSVSITDEIVGKWIPEAVDSRTIQGHQVKYCLPYNYAPKFSLIFSEFEKEIRKGESIKMYAVSTTTLEEVFLKVTADSDKSGRKYFLRNNLDYLDERYNIIQEKGKLRRSTFSIFFAMIKVRCYRQLRSPQYLILLLLPPFLISTALISVILFLREAKYDHSIFVSRTKEVYPTLHIAVNEITGEFSKFLSARGIAVYNYSGVFKDLLTVNPGVGTMAAVRITRHSFTDSYLLLTASMRINGTFVHSPTIILDLISKYFHSMAQQSAGNAPLRVSATDLTYHPFEQHGDFTLYITIFELLSSTFIFHSIAVVVEVVKDKEYKVRKHLQLNGLSVSMYFTTIFFVFGGLMLIPTIGVIFIFWLLDVHVLANPYGMTVIFGLLFVYTVPAQIVNANLCYLLDKLETVQLLALAFAFKSAEFSKAIVSTLDAETDAAFGDRSIVLVAHIICTIVFIHYTPFAAMYWTSKAFLTHVYLNDGNEGGISFSTFYTPEIISIFIINIIKIPLHFLALIAIDVRRNRGAVPTALSFLRRKHVKASKREDPAPAVGGAVVEADVRDEEVRVERYFTEKRQPKSMCNLAAYDVRKAYHKKQVVASVSFMVEKGEIFGLLGHNGAGKTTTIDILSLSELADSGQIRLCAHDIPTHDAEVYHSIGVCPQHNPLWNNVTLREHLQLYSTIRGIPKKKQHKHILYINKNLNFDDHMDKRADSLSGGTQRKLSYAMSSLGSPEFIFLDEPTTGMDPFTKRFVWNTMLATFKDSRAALLCTHSMEEADILCNRIAIMKSGSIACIGTPQHLKSKYGSGFSIELRLGPTPKAAFSDYTLESHTTATIGFVQPVDSGPAVHVTSEGEGEGRSTMTESVAYMDSSMATASPNEEGSFDIPAEFLFVVQHYPQSKLVELFGSRAIFSVPKTSVISIAEIFATLEGWKLTHNVLEYAFSETTLEQVFLSFNTNALITDDMRESNTIAD